MKKLLLLSVMFLTLISTGFTQPQSFDELCKKYKHFEGIETFRINGVGCFVASLLVGGEESRIGSLVRDCSSCRILISDGAQKRELAREIKSFICQNSLEELLTVKEDGEDVRIYVEEKKSRICQFFVTLTSGSEMVFIHLKGKFSKEEIREVMRDVA